MSEDELRAWQKEGRSAYHAAAQQDFLVSATPGSGKTRFATTIGRDLVDDGTVRQVVVVVPTDALRLQWADNPVLSLLPINGGETPMMKAGYDGIVVTYAQVSGTALPMLRRIVEKRSTLVIFDELHHAGTDRRWGDGLSQAFARATRRLALTGTPWRSDNNAIPFVRYGAVGMVEVDFAYGYPRSVADQVCRPVLFHSYDGRGRWIDRDTIVEAQSGKDLREQDQGIWLSALYDARAEWMPGLLRQAAIELAQIRADVPDAAGLVVAETQDAARAYATLLRSISGGEVSVVISDDADSKRRLDAFRDSLDPWIVAVRMVSEGVDIPRLSLGVWASKAMTPLFFRQVVGRFVRRRDGETHSAVLYVPAAPALTRYALEIEEELRHELDDEQMTRDPREPGSPPVARVPLSAGQLSFDRSILAGSEYLPADMDAARAKCSEYGIPHTYAANMAAMLRAELRSPQAMPAKPGPEPGPEPRHRRERALRSEIDRMTGRIAYLWGGPERKADVNLELRKAGFPKRGEASLQQLEEMLKVCGKLYDEARSE
jgi:superfamily II DNA or RNA helicase